MGRIAGWLLACVLLLSGGGSGAAGEPVPPGSLCQAPVPPAGRLGLRLHLARTHGCSQSTETTSLMAEVGLEVNGAAARLSMDSTESLSGGPSLGRFRQGSRDFFDRSTRSRWVYSGKARLTGGKLDVELERRQTLVDRAGGEAAAEPSEEAVSFKISCSAAGVRLGGKDASCRPVWLCRGLMELIPLSHESLSQLAPDALVEGALPLAAGAGIQVDVTSRSLGERLRLFSVPQPRLSR